MASDNEKLIQAEARYDEEEDIKEYPTGLLSGKEWQYESCDSGVYVNKLAEHDGKSDETETKNNMKEYVKNRNEETKNSLVTKYKSLQESLKKNKAEYEYVQQICCLPELQKIYIGLIPHSKQDQLAESLKQRYPDERIEVVIQTVNDTDWLCMPRISEFLGPGAALIKDDNLKIYTHYNKHRSDIHLVQDSIINQKELVWGSLACFVKQSVHEKYFLYGLTAQHVLGTPGEPINSENVISLFQHSYTIPTVQKMGVRRVTSKVEDIVLMCTANIVGECNKIKQDNEDVIVDAALFRLNDSVLELHSKFQPSREEKLKLVDFDKLDKLYSECKVYVKMVGATTGVKKGMLLSINHKNQLPNNKDIKGGVTFVVTSVDSNGNPHENGEFARKGDSGSLVILDEGNGEKKILGIVHSIKSTFEYGPRKFNNVTICVRMDHCEKMLLDKLDNGSKLDYYFYHLEPRLYLDTRRINPLTFSEDTDSNHLTSRPNSICPKCIIL